MSQHPILYRHQKHSDIRGSFMEAHRESVHGPIKQLNVLQSIANVFRGVHVTLSPGAGKLVTVIQGSVVDYTVDLRPQSPRPKEVENFLLTPGTSLFVPPGFGHGFFSLTGSHAVYGLTQEFDPTKEVKIKHTEFGITLPEGVILSQADQEALTLEEWKQHHELCVHFPSP